jgi:2-methylfumaryl-CoA isomerase
VAVLAAERHRTRTGEGSLVKLALSDVAFAAVGHLGRIAGTQLGASGDDKDGNYLYGAFGRDFATRDGRRVMIVGLTERQWAALKEATGIGGAVAALAAQTGLNLDREGARYAARERIAALLEPWFAARDLADVSRAFQGTGVSWGPYRTFSQALAEDPRLSTANPMFAEVDHPGIGPLLTPGTPLDFSGVPRLPPRSAPRLGADTDEILAEVLGLGSAEIGRLHDRRIVASSG